MCVRTGGEWRRIVSCYILVYFLFFSETPPLQGLRCQRPHIQDGWPATWQTDVAFRLECLRSEFELSSSPLKIICLFCYHTTLANN